jgi:hypothetical protein
MKIKAWTIRQQVHGTPGAVFKLDTCLLHWEIKSRLQVRNAIHLLLPTLLSSGSDWLAGSYGCLGNRPVITVVIPDLMALSISAVHSESM